MSQKIFAYGFVNPDDIYVFRTKINELIELYGLDALTVELPADLWEKFKGTRNHGALKGLKAEYATYNTVVLRIDCLRDGERIFRTYVFELEKKYAIDDLHQDTNKEK